MENGNNANNEEEVAEKQYLDATRAVILNGLDSLPDNVEVYRCPTCQKILLGPDILWKDMGNNVWEPFCPECEKIHLEKIR